MEQPQSQAYLELYHGAEETSRGLQETSKKELSLTQDPGARMTGHRDRNRMCSYVLPLFHFGVRPSWL